MNQQALRQSPNHQPNSTVSWMTIVHNSSGAENFVALPLPAVNVQSCPVRKTKTQEQNRARAVEYTD